MKYHILVEFFAKIFSFYDLWDQENMMQKLQSLNSLYFNYSSGLMEKQNLETAIFRSIQDYIRQSNILAGKDHDEYISWVYPRISRAIINYRDTGSSFDAYIGALVKLTIKEFRMRQVYSFTCETAAWVTQIPDMYTHESEPDYGGYISAGEEELAELPGKIKNPRQLLILILKCCRYVSHDFLEKIAPVLGIEPHELGEMIETLKDERTKRENHITNLKEKINYQFYRNIFYESAIRKMEPDSIAAQKYTMLLERGRMRLNKMRTRQAQMRPDPSNMRIAEMLGISKGTVDSVLYNLKKRGKLNQGNLMLN